MFKNTKKLILGHPNPHTNNRYVSESLSVKNQLVEKCRKQEKNDS
jgi:hypothetical protein